MPETHMVDETERVRALLLSCDGRRILPGDSVFEQLQALVERHPRADEKIGGGIIGFVVYRGWGNHIALDILRVDGARVDVSWRKCVSRHEFTQRAKLRRAMREAVDVQVRASRDYWLRTAAICGLCALPIEPGSDDVHIDHVVPFEQLVREFLKSYPTPAPTSFDENPETHMTCFRDTDRSWCGDWQWFHNERAKLRITHARCNLMRQRRAAADKVGGSADA